MTLLAIDPGNEQSAWCLYKSGTVADFGKDTNDEVLRLLKQECGGRFSTADEVAVEMIASYGMPVGREVFDTCLWVGRFIEAADRPWTLVYRRDVKLHLCGHVRAKDANIRQALIDRYGGKDKAMGHKAKPGPLYGVKADVWSAIAVAETYTDVAVRGVVDVCGRCGRRRSQSMGCPGQCKEAA